MNWTKEEILEYNKRCAEFLGYSNPITDKDFYFIAKDNYQDNGYIPKLLELNFEKRFYDDWNWIMEVAEAIEVLEIPLINKCEKYKRGFLKNSTYGSINLEAKYDPREEYKGWYCSVSIELSHPFIYDSLNEEKRRFKTKKEATVLAINQFLIWYDENK